MFSRSRIDSSLSGLARCRLLVKKAFADAGVIGNTPCLVASCHGSAVRRWEEAFNTRALLAGNAVGGYEYYRCLVRGVLRESHALYAARELLMSGAVEEVLVLAADILARSNHENFESLRVLAEKPSTPWQSTSTGFILGEAAVVLKLGQANIDELPMLHGPELASDLIEHDGLSDVIERLSPGIPTFILDRELDHTRTMQQNLKSGHIQTRRSQ